MLSAYSLTNHLPKATVVICFHNEALSVLLRTVLSVLNRTPPNLLDKIVLVNDASTLGDLSRGLSSKLFHMEKVVISNTERREGLVRARLLGEIREHSFPFQ
ncbi:polyprotein [Plakobranchus ocellatus]|uniref:Polyprotein n=1 Tax=Plakobranchus ocellatus TaxID=259542 RepID=A0AAV3YH78_9GAST|nr:polyprotein [Plakobranchus ocellatus]